MREEFEKMAAAGKLERHYIEPLVQLTTSGFCIHRSWGFGRIRTVDPVFARFTIDFPNKTGHTMDLAFAAQWLKPIPKDHILARKALDLDGLRQLAATNHLALVKLVLNSFGGKATLDQIQQVLVPEVISDDWKKWWEAARHELKKDGHFLVPAKKNEPVVFQAKEVLLQDRLLGEFRAAKGLKARIGVASELLKNAADLTDRPAAVAEVVASLNAETLSYQRTQPAVALEAVFVRDDVRLLAPGAAPPGLGELDAKAIWDQEPRLGALMEALPAAKHRRALESFEAANPEHWHEVLLNALNGVPAKLCHEFTGLLMPKDKAKTSKPASGTGLAEAGPASLGPEAQPTPSDMGPAEAGPVSPEAGAVAPTAVAPPPQSKMEMLKETLARFISQHTASSELLLWLAKDRSDAFADILGPEVFRAMLAAMERDQFNERRSNRLRDFILDDQDLLIELIGTADLEVIKDLTRALQFSPCFDDMDKRSLLARIVKSYPAVQSLISGEQPKQETHLVVSWESLERRKNEYHELVEKRIPANSKEIALARSYGDLSENHEYKAAKEMQKLLMRRKAELENQLVRARGADFSNPRTDVVSIGTVVRATDLETQQPEQFIILGAWDSEPDKGIISYLSPVAQALLNHKPGDEVEFEAHEVRHHHRIDSIEGFKPGPGPAPAATPAAAAPESGH